MAILEILKYPEPGLSGVALPVKNMTGETMQLIGDMLETMYAAPGVGLAAPQVGVSQRVVVLDVNHENPRKQVFKLINPVISRAEGEVIWEEGCLSVVDFTAEVRRAARVEITAFDEHEKEVKIEAEGLLAVALQHEIDHLDGKLFIDRISRLKKDLYTRRRKKMLRSGIVPPAENARVMI
ncbi:MAG TPA: peptide deformylase [Candidatus Binatia bacterium]|nr:peptide deformylase [Candidatus Binatia bacterium]